MTAVVVVILVAIALASVLHALRCERYAAAAIAQNDRLEHFAKACDASAQAAQTASESSYRLSELLLARDDERTAELREKSTPATSADDDPPCEQRDGDGGDRGELDVD